MSRKKDVYVPDKIFHEVCEKALEYDTEDIFVFEFRNSKQHKQLLKMGCDPSLEYDFLRHMYSVLHLSFAELLTKYSIKNSSLSHRLCIPIKTVEGWKSGLYNCPVYIKLQTLKEFNIEYLPKRIKRESERTALAKENSTNKNSLSKKIKKNEENKEIKKEPEIRNKYWSLKEYEQAHVYSSQANNILSTTNYLDDIIKRKKNHK